MRQLGYEPNKADSDLWMKECMWDYFIGPRKYYSYIQIYVTDKLCINDPNSILTQIDRYFSLKPDSLGEPEDVYLGARL